MGEHINCLMCGERQNSNSLGLVVCEKCADRIVVRSEPLPAKLNGTVIAFPARPAPDAPRTEQGSVTKEESI
jgi:hypothetical protein